ncbi:PQ loop repeat-domain-containing protein [Mrakia frigida]|uniref:PQ-loop repeat-containing protein n=1 Tax=Mrakia frigida TaxID=29902 RepID=UPI003FCC026F
MLSSSQELSSIFGWVSIACWVVVYSPQILQNFSLKSGEGLSVAFIVLWLIGDITNLLGGMMAGLLPTMIILAMYYTVCDLILLFQVYYYRHQKSSPLNQLTASSPLLPKPEPPLAHKSFLARSAVYLLAFGLVISTGVIAWLLNNKGGAQPGGGESEKGGDVLEWRSQSLGWISAVTYIGSRVPQILHNHQTKCEGLSLAMFFFSISGNLTYVASILFKSVRRRYIIANLPWLSGSALTVFLDIAVLCQFAYFSRQQKRIVLPSSEEARRSIVDEDD